MAKKKLKRQSFACSDPPLEDPLESCAEFGPSYDPSKLPPVGWIHTGSWDAQWMPAITKEVEEYLGLETGSLALSTRLVSLVAERLEASDINKILDDAKIPPIRGDLDALLQEGTVRDLLPPRPQHLKAKRKAQERRRYRKKVAECEELTVGDYLERGSPFRRAGCKREQHLMLPKGRLGFKSKGRKKSDWKRHDKTKRTEERWTRDLPYLDARTQGPAAVDAAKERSLEGMEERIREGLKSWGRTFGRLAQAPDVLRIPVNPDKLIAAGVPKRAAKILSHALGGESVPLRHPRSSMLGRVSRILGGAPLVFPTDDWKEAEPFFSLTGVSLRSVRGEEARGVRAFIGQWKKRGRLPLLGAAFRQGGRVIPLELESRQDFQARLEGLGPGESVLLVLGTSEDHVQLELQHSVLVGPQGSGPLPDYTTLRGFSLEELPAILARKVISPRRKRKGRRAQPLKAKKNPVATLTLTPEVQRMEPGSWLPYTLGAKVVPGNPDASVGKVVYRSMKKGAQPKVVSARRLASWLKVAQYGRRISVDAKGRKAKPPIPALEEAASLNPSRRNPQMARKKYPVYHSETLSGDPTLNKLTDWYYPGTIWDWYEEGEYGPYNVSVPVNRRNPRKGMSPAARARVSRVMKRAQAIIVQQGCSMSKAMKQAWAEEKGLKAAANPRKYKSHSTSVHRYKDSGHSARAKQAMRLKHERGISLKEAWAIVKSGKANPRPSRVKGQPYWPRHNEYAQSIDRYGQFTSTPLPPNRRNPGHMIGRFPQPCPVCGTSMKGQPIVQVGRGPRGGKKMAHANCA
ncbi:hypothetical protein CMI37_18860 [Candidatus Pacearchaeota archaeon]|nr:hypothetical protein [Candidatus Pacearchaeota archaeon]|tara:strand:+ start:129 stop:2531 length:2403 start_codon:yes stop_codon:yes gene_type:complete